MNASPTDYEIQVYSHWTWKGKKWDSRIVHQNGKKGWQSSQGYNNYNDALSVANRLSAATGIPVRVLP